MIPTMMLQYKWTISHFPGRQETGCSRHACCVEEGSRSW